MCSSLVPQFRHWHDLPRLDDAGVAARVLANRVVAHSVARHKAIFFREKDATSEEIDFSAAVGGELQLSRSGPTLEVQPDDYGRMLADGMLLDVDEPFKRLMVHCAGIETRTIARESQNDLSDAEDLSELPGNSMGCKGQRSESADASAAPRRGAMTHPGLDPASRGCIGDCEVSMHQSRHVSPGIAPAADRHPGLDT